MSDPKEYTIGWICAISTEYTAAQAFLDEKHPAPEPLSPADSNNYTVGKIGRHMVVIAVLPDGEYGTSSAANVARDMLHSFPNVRIGLMVGIGGGAPSSRHDVRLGDIVVSAPRDGKGGVFQYDFGKTIQSQAFQPTEVLNQPPTALRTVVSGLRSDYESEGHQLEGAVISALEKKPRLRKKYERPDPSSDRIYRSNFPHPTGNDGSCAVICGDDPAHLVLRPERTDDEDRVAIHYGLIASANHLMKDAMIRDKLAAEEGVLCFEMEAAGLMNHFPCLVIRGICDYADSHKNKDWQGYAAMIAAAYARDLLCRLAPTRVESERKINELLFGMNETISRTEANVATISSKLTKQDDVEALEWLTRNDQGPYQSDYLKRRQPGTGQWLLQSAEYQNWRTKENQTLFCSGIPGAGKTILTAIVIEDLTAQCSSNQSIGLAYIYCNFKLHNEQKVEDLLASILKQLASPVPESVTKLYEKHKDRRTRPSLNELSTTLQSVVETYERVFVVIDALDECQTTEDCRNVFLSQLFDLQENSAVRLFATARPIPKITERFIGDHLDIRAHESDLHRYLEGRISQAGSELLQSYKEEIKTRIAEVADGMFLLAQLLFDSIKTKMTLKQVKDTLKNISGGPDAYTLAYEDAKRRIEGQDADASKLAMNALMWITCAKRQLSIRELQEALAVEEGQSFLDRENVTGYKLIVSVCAGLIVVDEESQVVRLVHYTTQDYFEREQLAWFRDAECRLATVCVTYLSFDIFEEGLCMTDEEYETRLKQNPLYDYAARNWGYHAREAETDAKELIHAFLKNDAKVSASFQVMIASNWANFIFPDYSQKGAKMITGLHLAAWFGLIESAKSLLEHQVDVDSKEIFDQTPLSLAAEWGHEAVVRLLVEAGAEINSKDDDDRTPLFRAAKNGYEDIVKLLLDWGAFDTRDGVTSSKALCEAANIGDEDIVQLFLERGADLNLKDQDGITPLFWATKSYGVTKLLLEKGADLQVRDIGGRTPLFWAAMHGNNDVLKLFIEKGADWDLKDEDGGTPLFWATTTNSTTKLLLEMGADLHHRNKRGATPLFGASRYGLDHVPELLLEKGADLHLRDKFGRTPLFWAAGNGAEHVTKLYLEKGADFDVRDEDGKTPLFLAAMEGHDGVIKLLLEKGAEWNLKDKHDRTPLFHAVAYGHEVAVQLLLEKGADFDISDEDGKTPLSYAAEDGFEGVVKLLLEKGADFDLRDKDGKPPLSYAAKDGHEGVVKLLLERGAKFDLQDEDERPLIS
ncbi:ankyrin [Penicillium sp. IBT 16267x]|nr:ankyrin [Penicillium sp. IBT 16267x]